MSVQQKSKIYFTSSNSGSDFLSVSLIIIENYWNKFKRLLCSVPQIQGYMEILNVPYCDLMSYTAKGSIVFRIYRDRAYWALLYKTLEDFYFCLTNNIPPKLSHAKTAELLERSESKIF